MSTYTIIDEPKLGPMHKLILNPVIILFIAIFLPLFISLPFYSRWWAPVVWLIINGRLLGSPTKEKETVIGIIGILFFPLSLWFLTFLSNYSPDIYSIAIPYARLILQGALFFTLYLIVGYQSAPYSLHEYFLKKGR